MQFILQVIMPKLWGGGVLLQAIVLHRNIIFLDYQVASPSFLSKII